MKFCRIPIILHVPFSPFHILPFCHFAFRKILTNLITPPQAACMQSHRQLQDRAHLVNVANFSPCMQPSAAAIIVLAFYEMQNVDSPEITQRHHHRWALPPCRSLCVNILQNVKWQLAHWVCLRWLDAAAAATITATAEIGSDHSPITSRQHPANRLSPPPPRSDKIGWNWNSPGANYECRNQSSCNIETE